MVPQNLAPNVRAVRERIRRAAAAAGRSVDCVTVLAVSKTHSVDLIRGAAQEGLEHFGESYVQEALPKIETLRDLELTWHFIGQLQGNKTRAVAENFDWVHGVDRPRIARRLSDQRPFHAPPLNVCLQVNIGGESTKGGAASCASPRRKATSSGSATGLLKRRGCSAAFMCRERRWTRYRWG
jgi:pyridoxal phosphate enzyme (YggS family)